MRRVRTLGLGTVWALLLLAAGSAAFGQEPTAEQLELLNLLPPAQREAVLSQFLQQQGQADQPLEFPEVVVGASTNEIIELSPVQNPDAPPRLAAGDTIVIDFAIREDAFIGLSGPSGQLTEFGNRLAAGNPYELDGAGYLYLLGVPTMALAGLNVDEAVIRITAETLLAPFQLSVTLLPLEPVGVAALEPFGYDLFRGVPTTFAPATDVPVPSEYVMGPGDTVNVQLFGNQNAEYALVVSREGAINFPEIGPINVIGLTFVELREVITQRVAEQMIGVRSSITLGELRSIRIFVLGDVEQPGSYTVSGLTTMTNALFVSGGITEVGSLRQIELKRDGQTISTLDLYDLLLRGDTSADERLLPGDVIFAPPVGNTVAIGGSVRRPAIYELTEERTVDQLVELAGGFRPNADRSALKLERIVPGRGVTVHDLDLTGQLGESETLQDGDVVWVLPNLDQIEGAVRLSGNVFQPGLYQWVEGMTLTDLIGSPELVKPDSDLGYVLIRREIEPNVFVEALSTDLQSAWRQPKGIEDLNLQPRDTVHVFNSGISREAFVAPFISELRAQAFQNEIAFVVNVGGAVRVPGEYPLETSMTIMDLIRAGGGLTASAYERHAELTRRVKVSGGEFLGMQLLSVNLASAMAGNTAANLSLNPNDFLRVRLLPDVNFGGTVDLQGEILFPGVYSFKRGETLSAVLTRAGGLTDYAFTGGSVFLREELIQREIEQLEELAFRIQSEITATALSAAGGETGNILAMGQALVDRINNTEPTGRLTINLDQIITGNQSFDVTLNSGDTLLVPQMKQEVTVMGEVQYATSHLYRDGLARDDYIDLSGGRTSRADERRIFIVRANGEVLARQRSRWFSRQGTGTGNIRPGDTVVVPLATPVQSLAFWSSMTQIMYNLAIASAAVASF
jgi:protein involved in polysaccharide export with SLBB domain